MLLWNIDMSIYSNLQPCNSCARGTNGVHALALVSSQSLVRLHALGRRPPYCSGQSMCVLSCERKTEPEPVPACTCLHLGYIDQKFPLQSVQHVHVHCKIVAAPTSLPRQSRQNATLHIATPAAPWQRRARTVWHPLQQWLHTTLQPNARRVDEAAINTHGR